MNISLKIQEEDNNSLTEIVSHLTNLTDPHHSRSTSSPMSLTLSSLIPDTKGRGSYFYYQVLVTGQGKEMPILLVSRGLKSCLALWVLWVTHWGSMVETASYGSKQ